MLDRVGGTAQMLVGLFGKTHIPLRIFRYGKFIITSYHGTHGRKHLGNRERHLFYIVKKISAYFEENKLVTDEVCKVI